MTTSAELLSERPRLLLVGKPPGNGELVSQLAVRYPALEIQAADSFLSAMFEVRRKPVRAVLACVDRRLSRLNSAVAGLRETAGPQSRIILYCQPVDEPLARAALPHGADDYCLHPPDFRELDQALAYPRLEASALPTVDFQPELRAIAAAVAEIGTNEMALLDRLAAMIRASLHASAVSLSLQGITVQSGEAKGSVVVSHQINDAGQILGRIDLSAREGGAYTPAEIARLETYADLAARLIVASRTQNELRRLAMTDEASGLPNRRCFREQLARILQRASTERFPVAVLFFDIDDFKSYNDRFGHAAGDEIIRVTGNLFRTRCREQDIVARTGGDEFSVIFWDPSGPREPGSRASGAPGHVLDVVDRFKSAIQSHRFQTFSAPEGVRLTISGGLAVYPWDAGNMDELLKRADQALLAAKRAGKNKVFIIGEHPTE